MKRFFKRNGRRIAVLTCGIYLFHIVAPVYYGKLQAELYMSISGKVVDKQTGQGIPNVNLFILRKMPADDRSDFHVTTSDVNGFYSFQVLPPDDYLVTLIPPKPYLFLSYFQNITVPRGKNVTEVNFFLESGVAVSGAVYAADNKPLVGVPIIMLSDQGGLDAALTDSEGRYSVSSFPNSQSVSLTLIPRGYASITLPNINTQGNSTNVNFKLSNIDSEISGKIKSSLTGEAIRNAFVLLENKEKGIVGFSQTSSSGEFKISGLPATKYKVFIVTEGYTIFEQLDFSIPSEGVTKVDFLLTPQAPQQNFNSQELLNICSAKEGQSITEDHNSIIDCSDLTVEWGCHLICEMIWEILCHAAIKNPYVCVRLGFVVCYSACYELCKEPKICPSPIDDSPWATRSFELWPE